MWGLIGIIAVINIILSVLLEVYKEDVIGIIVLTIAQIMLGIIIQIGVYRILLNLSVGKKVDYGQLIGNSQYFIRFFLAGLLYALIVAVGYILLIVPGIVWSIKYGQWPYLMLEKNMGVMDSLRKSGEITYGAKMDIFILALALFGIMFVSIIPLGLGLIITIPLSALVPVLVYRELTREQVTTTSGTEPVIPEHTTEEQAPLTPTTG